MARALLLLVLMALPLALPAQELQSLLQAHAEEVADPSRSSVDTVLDPLVESGLPAVATFLARWQDREVVRNTGDGLFYYAGGTEGGTVTLLDIATGEAAGEAPADAVEEIRPNGGVRREIAGALVAFQLSDPDIRARRAALAEIARSPDESQIEPLLDSLAGEEDDAIRAEKARLVDILRARFGDDTETRVAAIEGMAGDMSTTVRGALSQILATSAYIDTAEPTGNVARLLRPGTDMTMDEAYARLVNAGLAPPRISPEQVRAALIANIADGSVGGEPVSALSSDAARIRAYEALAAQGLAEPFVTEEELQAAVAAHVFAEVHDEDDPAVTDAARAVLTGIERKVGVNQAADLALDAISLASIYFLAAIGLAITFGVMGVINMAHGEFIMMGAYTGYLVQTVIPDYTLSLIVAVPLAFVVGAAAGIAMERLVIRHLYKRPLETLLATFGVSIALQQLAKVIFGTQARPLTSPAWLNGQLAFNEIVAISYIRVAIFVLALIFFGLLLFILRRTRLGLEVRAVTQNPGMAGSMGIDPGRINMLTFALGSGIAGIAGVAIGLYAQVTSEMGANYIVQSFMTVVVGGVGNIWGTLAGAGLIGVLQKGIEWLNPSNTLAAQTYMILFIILFIQVRPRGIVALKGRAAEA
ncbi:urea ABC transporter permease subunit UrtB [Wenxinia saemankumensis]|uniref:Amino acid/amide ABC transporter membrane protein 1, HAAT family n=1 Tax=Wenxinia saemankumensis TaxID=1447782 RepID=A0A1M6AB88_9RHOB|nr:urea ABC transporter permease subunit UrtB [Wenxinia saemankumensis]SHI33709.1 amino acid/amide ABC transporter membrane protein 1, HAAT family [Wenxinia saemankumensis]